MDIIAHRGFWNNLDEKNSMEAIKRALDHGFGVETDIRDYHGRLVVSHNVATTDCFLFEEILVYYQRISSCACLALNIKADGLLDLLEPLLKKYNILKYFLFDMSIPELVVSEKKKHYFYTRQSDIENECVMYERAAGVWMDSFYDGSWLTSEVISNHLKRRKKVSLVSPELHNNDYIKMWQMLKKEGLHNNSQLSLCTDYPSKARGFFLR